MNNLDIANLIFAWISYNLLLHIITFSIYYYVLTLIDTDLETTSPQKLANEVREPKAYILVLSLVCFKCGIGHLACNKPPRFEHRRPRRYPVVRGVTLSSFNNR